jgi:hypothetical protein
MNGLACDLVEFAGARIKVPGLGGGLVFWLWGV